MVCNFLPTQSTRRHTHTLTYGAHTLATPVAVAAPRAQQYHTANSPRLECRVHLLHKEPPHGVATEVHDGKPQRVDQCDDAVDVVLQQPCVKLRCCTESAGGRGFGYYNCAVRTALYTPHHIPTWLAEAKVRTHEVYHYTTTPPNSPTAQHRGQESHRKGVCEHAVYYDERRGVLHTTGVLVVAV